MIFGLRVIVLKNMYNKTEKIERTAFTLKPKVDFFQSQRLPLSRIAECVKGSAKL